MEMLSLFFRVMCLFGNSYEAEAEEKISETVIKKIFDELPVP